MFFERLKKSNFHSVNVMLLVQFTAYLNNSSYFLDTMLLQELRKIGKFTKIREGDQNLYPENDLL